VSVGWTQIEALGAELEGLIRAGIPLGAGVRDFAGRSRGALRAEAKLLATQLEQGTPLDQALTNRPGAPAVLRAVVAAGLKSGRPAEVLRSFCTIARELLEMQHAIARSLYYPLWLLMACYSMFVGFAVWTAPVIVAIVTSPDGRRPVWAEVLQRLQSTVNLWGPTIPLVLVAYHLCRRFLGPASLPGGGLLSWLLPGFRGLQHDVQLTQVTQVLAVLSEAETPLPTSLRLAADLSPRSGLRRELQELSSKLEAGQPASQAVQSLRTLPPLWRWMFALGVRESQLGPALREAAAVYHQRVLLRADCLARLAPAIVLLVVGGGAVTFYALSLFYPVVQLWAEVNSTT
jgi:type II secretory pathway component PulF